MKTVLVDVHEPSAYFAHLREIGKTRGWSVEQAPLPAGDYVCGRIAVERKAGDLWGSIKSGRLWDQARALKDNFEKGFVVYVRGEDESARFAKGRKSRRLGILAAQYSLPYSFGIPLITVENRHEFAWVLRQIFEREDRETVRPSQIVRKGATMDECREDALRCIPGVGAKKARALLEAHGSVVEVVKAVAEQKTKLGEKDSANVLDLFFGAYGAGRAAD